MVKKSFPAFVMNGWNVTATGVKASTYVKNRNIVKNHIKPTFGGYSLSQFNAIAVNDFKP